jgi:hypothetical protein
VPVAIVNFVEGTRWSRNKQEQSSPYRYLLRPRIGGIAFVLASLSDQLDAMIDVTLAYPRHDVTMWEFVSNRIPEIRVSARRLEVPEELLDGAITEPGAMREQFREWMDERWREKDRLLGDLLEH